ncbi:MAG: hypothetical protein VX563_02690, partial [Planctomycetota bacterium]|nr:hypothetical protein [Planctomycetota bacterium]
MPTSDAPARPRIHRFEVQPAAGHTDPVGESLTRSLARLDPDHAPSEVRHAAIYLIEGALSIEQLDRIGRELLA